MVENFVKKLDFKQKLNTFDEISPSKSTSESDDSQAGFLVSFIVDARGGVMTSQRRPELRFIIPENTCPSPTRITCRLARYNKPPLSEGESQASRVLEVTPHSMHFNRYVTFVLRIACWRHAVVKMSYTYSLHKLATIFQNQKQNVSKIMKFGTFRIIGQHPSGLEVGCPRGSLRVLFFLKLQT